MGDVSSVVRILDFIGKVDASVVTFAQQIAPDWIGGAIDTIKIKLDTAQGGNFQRSM